MKNQRKTGVIFSYFILLFNGVVSVLYIPILLGYMDIREYGLYKLMTSFVVYFSMMDFRIGSVLTRFYTQYHTEKNMVKLENTVMLMLLIFCCISIMIILLGSIVYFHINSIFMESLNYMEIETAKMIYIFLIINIIFLILGNLINAIILSHEKFLFFNTTGFFQIAIQPFLIIQVMQFRADSVALVLTQTVCNISFVVFKILYCFFTLKLKIKYHYYDKEILKCIRRLGVNLFVVAIFDQVFLQSNQVILGVVTGTSAVAIYSIALQIYMNYYPFSNVFTQILFPKITKMIVRNASNQELSNLFIRIGRLQFYVLSSILSTFIIFGNEFIELWVGSDYREAYYIAMIIMIPFTINLIQTMGIIILQAKNQYGFRAATYALVGVLNIIIAIPAAIYFGGIGCAIVTGICYLIGDGVVMNIYYKRNVGIDINRFWSEIFQIMKSLFLCFIIGVFLKILFSNLTLLSFSLEIGIYLFFYISIMWLHSFNAYEKELFAEGVEKLCKIKRLIKIH